MNFCGFPVVGALRFAADNGLWYRLGFRGDLIVTRAMAVRSREMWITVFRISCKTMSSPGVLYMARRPPWEAVSGKKWVIIKGIRQHMWKLSQVLM